ncbi:MAG: hypothetical protein M3Y53_09765 [Thermoproteota archaeon]|nr:hypothetical protein [Thermoproteota archaeon]
MIKSESSSFLGFDFKLLVYVVFILRYIQYPTPAIIAKIIRPIMMGASTCIRNIMIATMTISAIIPTIIDPTLPAEPKDYYP